MKRDWLWEVVDPLVVWRFVSLSLRSTGNVAKKWYCWCSKGALQLGFALTGKPFCYTRAAGRAFLIQGMHIFIGERKIWKINCDVSRIFLFLLKGRKCYVFMKYQLIRNAGQHIARFALLMKVVWCNLYKINSHLKMLGSCWVEVLGRWREMSSGGTCSAEPCQRGPSTGPQPRA